jgi:hypothetical protein
MSYWDTLAALPVSVQELSLRPLVAEVSSGFLRRSTVVALAGAGEEGLGEDVIYDAVDHEKLLVACGLPIEEGGSVPIGPGQPLSDGFALPLAGEFTLGSFCERLAELDLFPSAPEREASVNYRTWAFESAALDLALRQASTNLHAVLDRPVEPVRFVVSLRLGEPPSVSPVDERLALYPWLRFKLDPTSSWDEPLIAQLVSTGAVESVDFKAYYSGSIVDQPPDPVLYRRVIEAFPDAWIEDPALTEETDAVLAGARERFSWDAPIHSVADIEALRYAPQMVNIKPSRLGPIRNLMAAYEYCQKRGIGNYGGGQFELGVGRGQIQYLAALFHADAPNDVAPTGFNEPEPPGGLPSSPLAITPTATGFRLADGATLASQPGSSEHSG